MNTIDTHAMRPGGLAGLDTGASQAAAMPPRPEAGVGADLTVGTSTPSVLDALDEVDSAVEAALTRTDDLGKLMNRVFNLPPPPLPDLN